jgi:hypothetical protein
MRSAWLSVGTFILLMTASPGFGVNVLISETLPWAFRKTENAPFDGIGVRMIKELSRRSGVKLTAQVLPTARHLTQFKTMDQALSIAMEHNFTNSDGPVLAVLALYPTVVMIPKGSQAGTYEDLIAHSKELGIGVLRGLTYKPLTDDERIRKTPINDIPSGLRMLNSGRLAGICGSQPLLLANVRRLKLENLPGPQITIGEVAFVLRMRPKSLSATQSKRIKDAVKSMQQDGTILHMFSLIPYD